MIAWYTFQLDCLAVASIFYQYSFLPIFHIPVRGIITFNNSDPKH